MIYCCTLVLNALTLVSIKPRTSTVFCISKSLLNHKRVYFPVVLGEVLVRVVMIDHKHWNLGVNLNLATSNVNVCRFIILL
jgi:hypothetical protein